MPDLPSRPQLFDVGRDEILTRAEAKPYGTRISPQEIDTEGSDINLLLAAASIMGEEVSRKASRELTDLTLDGAEGEALDRWAADRYGTEIVRKTASPSVGTLQFTRSSSAAGAITFLAGGVIKDDGGNEYETLADVAFGVASLGPINVSARAKKAGTAGNAPINTITSFVTPSGDSSIVVTNPDVFAGGSDTESDEKFRARIRLFWAQARRGIQGAIEFGALTVDGVTQASAIEQLNSLGVPNGFVFLYIADDNGQSNAALNASVLLALLDYRAYGIVVNVFSSIPIFQSIELDLSYKTGVDTIAAFDNVRRNVVAAVNGLAPNETLLTSLIVEAARRVTGVIVADDAVVVPAGDVVPSTGQLIRTRADIVTASA
jgi:uncharacterized phage protein gp47/JayE